MQVFEVFIRKRAATTSQWAKLIQEIRKYQKHLVLEVRVNNNLLSFFLHTRKDISPFFSKFYPFLLKPATNFRPPTKNIFKRRGLISLKNKNLVETLEKSELKKSVKIERVVIEFGTYFGLLGNKTTIYSRDNQGKNYKTAKLRPDFDFKLLSFDLEKNFRYRIKDIPLYLKIEGVSKLFTTDHEDSFLQVYGFPYFASNHYFSLKNFDFINHSLIVGQTGTGKSKLIELFIRKLQKHDSKNQHAVFLVDPHAALCQEMTDLNSLWNLDFKTKFSQFFMQDAEPRSASTMLVMLFKSLLKDQSNPRTERVLQYVAFALYQTKKMSLDNLRRFLTDIKFRKQVLDENVIEENTKQFFNTEFLEIQTKFYEKAVMPILGLIDELSFLPSLKEEGSPSIESLLNEKSVVALSLDRMNLGEKTVRLIAGLLTQQVFFLAQQKRLKKKVILIVDEVSLVENESLISILSQARKFNLGLWLSQQYLTQVSKPLLDGILANAYNYFIFKISDEEASLLAKSIKMNFTDEIVKTAKDKGLKEEVLRQRMMTELDQRELIVRAHFQNKFHEAFKARTLDTKGGGKS